MEARPQKTSAVVTLYSDSDIDGLLQERGKLDSALRKHKSKLAILFTDIVGSTSFFERYGDTAGLIMLHRHDMLVMPAVEDAGGTVVKTIGDAVLATFPEADKAVEAAIQIQRRLEQHNRHQTEEEKIYVRVGINFGTGIVKDKDVFGDVVNVAARFVKNCAPAQILVSRSVYESIRDASSTTVRQLGSASLHGKSEREDIYEILWTSQEEYERLREQLDAGAAVPSSRSALGRYELLEELGRGAMGVVHKAFDPAVNRIVALKTVRLDVSGKERKELIERLRREAQAAGRLEHANIVTIYDAGEAEGLFYLTMQYVKGKTLAEILEEHKLLPVEEVSHLVEQLCEGLHYAHENGIVHRDLKPTNIIVTAEGRPKIVDFGVAKIVEAGSTKAGVVVGTPSYMSPEQAQGARVDRRSDVFSLGTILYELLAGEKAFPGNTPTAIIYKILHEDPIPLRVVERTVSPALEQVVNKALAKSPYERYQTCRELLEDLAGGTRRAAAAKAPAAKVAESQPPVEAGRKRAWGWVAAIGLLLAAGTVWELQQGWFSDLHNSIFHPFESQAIDAAINQPPAVRATQPEGASGVAGGGESRVQTAGSGSSLQASPGAAAKEPAGLSGPAKGEPTQASAKPPVDAPVTAAVETKKVTRTPARRVRTLTPEQQREVNSWLRQAEQYMGRGRYDEASFALKKALDVDPNNKPAREALQKVQKELSRRQASGHSQ
jgi:class 3 adenylate cyclase/predicted Ser/Thr protein kinase